ncbi:hypothetical protein ILUMI_27392 [Ignelater luminosus]|uniref:Uncharacterized protein n=1 Tax=Ignelater luminosus TaxID=2038154 RepID=A0A8K0C689_IGNLU|nr:hypothetical protein ILUMI_27392 [Ignelater luminosus]
MTKLSKICDFGIQRLNHSHLKTTYQHNLRHRLVTFNEGDFVWKKEHTLSDASKNYSSKLGTTFSGLYKVKNKLGIDTYKIEDRLGRNKGLWHVRDLKLDQTLEPHEKW